MTAQTTFKAHASFLAPPSSARIEAELQAASLLVASGPTGFLRFFPAFNGSEVLFFADREFSVKMEVV